MKFTEQEAYNEIVAKLKEKEANPLINERSLKAMVARDFVMLGDSEIELDAYAIGSADLAKNIDGNIRKNNKIAIEDYVKNNPPQDPTAANEESESRLKVLEEENTQLKTERMVTEKRDSIVAAFKEKGVSDNEWISKALEAIPVTKETEVDQFVEKGIALYNLTKSQHGDYTPGESDKGVGSSSLAKAANLITQKSNQKMF